MSLMGLRGRAGRWRWGMFDFSPFGLQYLPWDVRGWEEGLNHDVVLCLGLSLCFFFSQRCHCLYFTPLFTQFSCRGAFTGWFR